MRKHSCIFCYNIHCPRFLKTVFHGSRGLFVFFLGKTSFVLIPFPQTLVKHPTPEAFTMVKSRRSLFLLLLFTTTKPSGSQGPTAACPGPVPRNTQTCIFYTAKLQPEENCYTLNFLLSRCETKPNSLHSYLKMGPLPSMPLKEPG